MAVRRLTLPDHLLPMLVADVGGTNARFALLRDKEEGFINERVLAAAEYERFDQAVLAYLDGQQPASACLAVAGPILGDEVVLTNRDWAFSMGELKQTIGVSRLEVINDFAALSMALPFLGEHELARIGPEGLSPSQGAPKLVVGPGTGLGGAGLVPFGDRWIPVPGECGHASFAPATVMEQRILVYLSEEHEHISWEDLLSGPGLERIYLVLLALGEITGDPRKADEITRGALAGEVGAALALDTFCGLLGGFAGDFALSIGARGGVYLGGGILPRIVSFAHTGCFRERFQAKGRMSHFLEGIPTWVITAKIPAFLGAAAWLAQES